MPTSIPFLTFLLFLSHSLLGQSCDADLLETQINSLLAKGLFEEADTVAKHWLKCSEELDDIQSVYWARMYRYQAARNRRKYKTAFRHAEKARKIWNAIPPENRQEEGYFYIAQAEAAIMGKEVALSKKYLAEAQRWISDQHETDFFIQAYYTFTKGFYHQHGDHQYDLARESFQHALELLVKMPKPPVYLIGQTLRWLGTTNRIDGDFEKAIYFYGRELSYYEAAYPPSHPEIANTNYNIGAVQYELLRYEDALKSFLRTHAIWKDMREPDDKFMRYLNEAIGDMYWELGNRDKTLEFYDLAVAGEEPINNDLAFNMLKKGDTLFETGNHDPAMQHFQQALDWRVGMYGRQHAMSGACQNFIGKKHFESGNLDAAIASYQQTIQMMVPDMDDTIGISNPSVELPVVSEQNLLEALASKGIALADRYLLHKQPEDLTAAYETLQLATFWMEKLRISPVSESAKAFWSGKNFRVFEKMIEMALVQYELTRDPTFYHAAFEASEKSKAFLLIAALQSHESSSMAGIPDSVIQRENELRHNIGEYSGKIGLEEQRCGAARERQIELWHEKLLKLTAEHDAFLKKMATSYPAYHALKYNVQTVRVGDLQQGILADGDAGLIEIFEGEERVYVFAVTAEKMDFIRITDKNLYDEKIQDILQNIKTPSYFLQHPEQAYQQFVSDSHALYNLLFSDQFDNLKSAERIYIIPDGQLFFFPFECLLTAQVKSPQRDYKNLPYLIKKQRIAYSQSATLLSQSSNVHGHEFGKNEYLAFAPDYEKVRYENLPLSPLYANLNEAAAGAKLFSGKAYLDTEASESNFKLSASDAGLLHLSMHTFLDHEEPMLSRILFCPDDNEDGQLHGFELYGLEIPAQLTVLSACNTASGTFHRGEGMMSLERGFQYAGCPSLLTTLWTVDDNSSSSLVLSFLENFKNEMPKDKALQTAQLTYLENADPASTHPFFWAGFHLTGNVEPLESSTSFWWWGLFLLFGAGLYFWKWS